MKMAALSEIRGVLFDLDGTLLQVEMKDFIPAYVSSLAECFNDLVDRALFADALLSATFALLHARKGGPTNEELFLAALDRRLGIAPAQFAERFEDFCASGLTTLAEHVRPLPLARKILELCFDRGLKVAIATNPVFPRPVVEARLRWGNLHDFDFAHVSTFENSRFCKPDPKYFHDLLETLEMTPQECLMVGNDTEHDLAAREVGIRTYLVDTWLIDRLNGAYEYDFRGGHPELFSFMEQLTPNGGSY
jgi:FMN phosphatase YigB (HAD superfamily)